MQTMFQRMKYILPPRTSFRLRTMKSALVDKELRELHRFAKALGGPAINAVDVGANSGIYSAALSAHFQKVVAIEPNPDCVAYMLKVLPENCEVIAAAVSNIEGRTLLRVPVVGNSSETTRATISSANTFQGLNVSGTVEIDVAVQSIDSMARAGLFKPELLGLIKIDVEGHEFAVLSGANEVLRSAQPALCVEIERRHGTQTEDALDLLRGMGYVAIRFENGRYNFDRPVLTNQRRSSVNMFFVANKDQKKFNLAA